MLSTNVELQETKVKDSDIKDFIGMIRTYSMSASYLDLLRSVCSCQGHGVDGNQCRVVELWLNESEDLNMKLVRDTTPPIPPDSVTWHSPPNLELASEMLGGSLLTHGFPMLLVKWETDIPELKPENFDSDGATKGVPLERLFAVTNDKHLVKLQKYFISQLYLDAVRRIRHALSAS
jgi:hypothetical protein